MISLSKGKEAKKKLLQQRVFVFWHPSRCEPRLTGLNFAEQARRGIVTLNLENGPSVNSDNFDATDLRSGVNRGMEIRRSMFFFARFTAKIYNPCDF